MWMFWSALSFILVTCYITLRLYGHRWSGLTERSYTHLDLSACSRSLVIPFFPLRGLTIHSDLGISGIEGLRTALQGSAAIAAGLTHLRRSCAPYGIYLHSLHVSPHRLWVRLKPFNSQPLEATAVAALIPVLQALRDAIQQVIATPTDQGTTAYSLTLDNQVNPARSLRLDVPARFHAQQIAGQAVRDITLPVYQGRLGVPWMSRQPAEGFKLQLD